MVLEGKNGAKLNARQIKLRANIPVPESG